MNGNAVTQIGFTAPARIWPKIDNVEASAASLNTLVQRYVGQNTDQGRAFKQSWDAWYSNWRKNYYVKYQSTLAKLGALSGSDELDRQVEDQREQLVGFYESYERQRQIDGAAVPPAGPRPQRAPEPGKGGGSTSWSLPWWFWLAVGGAAVGVGYLFYRRYRQIQNQAEIAETKLLPAVFERIGLPGKEAVEVVQAGHRDYSFDVPRLPPRHDPFSIASLARDYEVSSDGGDVLPNFEYDRARDPFRL